MNPRRGGGLLALCLASTALPLGGQGPCHPNPAHRSGSYDLYCIPLLPAAGSTATGTAQLDWISGPFTVPVARDGTHRWQLTFTLVDLPLLPAGPAPGFVAWATPMSLSPMTRLGVVGASRTVLGPVALEQFLVMVSAEPDTTASNRQGRLVLRGQSASTRLRPADLYEFFLGAFGTGTWDSASSSPTHDHGAPAQPDSLGWMPVPVYPGLAMLPSEMALRPPVGRWSPPEDPTAPLARPRTMVALADGDTLDLVAGVVRRTLAGRSYTMFGFNGQYPGPLLQVPEGAGIVVRFTNQLPLPSTIHWHGLRLEARFDGVPGLSQAPVAPGETFVYHLVFPDGGLFWYHPHVREDIQQDLGLYGNIFVRPSRQDTYAPAHREEFLMLDDLLIGDDGLVPWGKDTPTHAAMGRFGNVMLVNGEPEWRLSVERGAVVRLFLTNASNTRTFNVSFGVGLRIKMVGSDLGTFAREEWVESIVVAPAERYIVDVRFDEAGSVALENVVRARDHLAGHFFSSVDTLGIVDVAERDAPPLQTRFDDLRRNPSESDLMRLVREHANQAPQHTLELRARFTDLPFVTQRLMRVDSIYVSPVEWEGTMPGMNWATIGTQAGWALRDYDTGLENAEIGWRFRKGDKVRIRVLGVRETLHAMQHPVHFHGQRFLVLAVNGIRNENPVWKDTVLVPAGSAVDLLVEMSNPGRWMLHCHIAEHLQAGMMTVFDVEDL